MTASRRFLLTGATGFIGRHAARELIAAGHEVVAAARSRQAIDPAVVFMACDLLSPHDVRRAVEFARADTLLHLAWETRHGYFWHAPENLDWLAASSLLVRAFREAGGQRVVVAGTCAEYEVTSDGLCNAISTPCSPRHLYSATKDSLNRALTAYASTVGLSYSWGRIFHLAGPGEAGARLVPAAIKSLSEGRIFATGSGRKRLDFMDARDCGSAFASLAMSSFQGAINVASGQPTTIATILASVADTMGRPDLIGFGMRPDPVGDLSDRWADVMPLRDALGFRPQFTLNDTVRAAVASVMTAADLKDSQ